MPAFPPLPTPAAGRALLLWCAFIVYGSLLPFELRPLSLAQAWAQFERIRWLDLGIASRLDWLSNLLLYLPAGFLGTAWIDSRLTRGNGAPGLPSRLTASAAVAVAGAGLAVAVEFAQLFFAPRTVSLNDLAAEILGTLLGCTAALAAGRWLAGLLAATRDGPAREAWLALYLLAYLGLSFFPFDFSTPLAALEHKLAAGHAGWWWAPFQPGLSGVALLKLVLEVGLTLPFGVAMAAGARRISWPTAFAAGAVLGLAIEGLQLFLLSATSQGASVLTRAVGVALGAALQPRLGGLRRLATPGRARALAALLALPWLGALAVLAGWGSSRVATAGWPERLDGLRWLPLYYHYYAGEAQALTSALMCVASYAWVGIAAALGWARPSAVLAAGVAGIVAGGIEASKLVLVGRHPDPSNVWIAAVAAWSACWIVMRMRAAPTAGDRVVAAGRAAPATRPALDRPPPAREAPVRPLGWELPAAMTVVALAFLAPAPWLALAGAAAVTLACMRLRPDAILFLVPVALALTDAATWHGIRWFDAVDGVMLGAVAAASLWPSDNRRAAGVPAASVLLFALALAPGTLLGMIDLDIGDPNALLTPMGSGTGALMAKAVLWAFVLAWVVRRLGIGAAAGGAALARGMAIALAGITVLTVWERLAFVGPFDFASDYRAPGPFSAIALGGAYIECFLAAATPFAVVAAFTERQRLARLAAAALLPLAAYATMVTFSRGGQVVFLAVTGLAIAAMALRRLSAPTLAGAPATVLKAGALLATIGALATVILLAPYASTRFQSLGTDAQGRLDHWRAGLSYGDGGGRAWLAGNGLGSFGRAAQVMAPPRERPGLFELRRDAGNTWLHSTPGSLSYLDQRVDVRRGEVLVASARLRGEKGLTIEGLLCEKDLVQSRTCGTARLRTTVDGEWQRVETLVVLPPNPVAGWPERPLRFTLFNGGRGEVEIDDLSLRDAQGREHLVNGDFESAGAHWLYSSDRHLTWHMKSLWLQIFFEQGLAGVLGHAGLLLAGLMGAWAGLRRGHPPFLAVMLALLAFHGVGLIDSVIDTPRFVQLYLVLALSGWFLGGAAGEASPAVG